MNTPLLAVRHQTHKLEIRPWSIVILALCLLGIYFLLPQLGELKQSLAILAHAHPGLIALSLGLVVGDILLSAYAQQLAASRYGDFKKVLRRELAGMFLNHFLPYSVGIVTLVEEYYRKITNDRTYAYFVAIMPVLANFIISFIVLVLISPFTLLYISHQMSGHTPTWVTLALLAGGLGLVVLTVVYWQRIKSMIQLVLHTMRRTRPRTVTAVLAVVALQVGINSATLWLIALSVGVAVPVMTALALILASNFTGNAAPTPGGIAVAEATLVIGMTSAGLTLPDAVAITLLYRFVTFWLELIPGGWAMATIQLRSSHHDY